MNRVVVLRLQKKKLDGTPRSVGLMVFGRQGIRVPDPLPPHPTARTQNNNPIQTTGCTTNTCSHAHHSIAKDSDHNAGNGERRRKCRLPIPHQDMPVAHQKVSFTVRVSNREFAWCVPSLHKATHTRTQSRKTGGDDGQGRKNPGEETTAKKLSAPAADTRPAL